MDKNKYFSVLKINFKKSSLELLKLYIIFFLSDIILRMYEFFITSPYFSDNNAIAKLQLSGYYHDNFKILTLLCIFFPIYFLLRLVIKKWIFGIVALLLLLFLIISFTTVQYYIVSFIPLDKSFYTYSINDIIKILNSSSDLKWTSYFTLFAIIVLFFVLIKKLNFKSKYYVIFIWLLWIISMVNISYSHVKAKFFPNIQDYYLVKNKAIFFLEDSFRYFDSENEKKNTVDIKSLAKEYSKIYPKNKYIFPEYPLLRKNDDKDVLGKYFNLPDTTPNFVFLFLESMGRNICGPNARFGSYTPFLDSLIGKSLYWENCLSTAERTYGAIPNILGSLPSGEGGFYYHKDKPVPFNKSLISYLSELEYRTGFYYGGWPHFQNMDDILNSNRIDYILTDFDSTAVKIESDKEGFSWGYNDKSVFEQYFKVVNNDSLKNKKRLDIILTMSLHSPFMAPNKDYYNKKVKEISEKYPENLKKIALQYQNVLSTVVYVDDALKWFFEEFKKLPEYKNTIFILAADHNIHAFPDDNEIRRYHIPLIIYSPMLKKAVKFSAVNSHREIAPSILALLRNNYKIKLDDNISMIGNSLDDSKTFVCNKTISLFKGSSENISMIDKGYFTIDNKYYKLKDNFILEPLYDEKIKKRLEEKVNVIREINKYVYFQNKIIPPKYLMK